MKLKLTAANPTSAPAVLKSYFALDFKLDPEWEDVFVDSMLQMEIGEDFYPGNSIKCPQWPFAAPGDKGIANAMSPKYVNLSSITNIKPKPPILWFRGAKDSIVSDASLLDIGYLGKLGYVPGWPGDEFFPAHPMVTQTRYILKNIKKLADATKNLYLRMLDMDLKGQIELYNTFKNDVYMTHELKNIKCPAMIICGSEDLLKRPKFSKIIHDNIKNSEYVIIPECGHVAIFEKVEEVKSILLGFILKHLA